MTRAMPVILKYCLSVSKFFQQQTNKLAIYKFKLFLKITLVYFSLSDDFHMEFKLSSSLVCSLAFSPLSRESKRPIARYFNHETARTKQNSSALYGQKRRESLSPEPCVGNSILSASLIALVPSIQSIKAALVSVRNVWTLYICVGCGCVCVRAFVFVCSMYTTIMYLTHPRLRRASKLGHSR